MAARTRSAAVGLAVVSGGCAAKLGVGVVGSAGLRLQAHRLRPQAMSKIERRINFVVGIIIHSPCLSLAD